MKKAQKICTILAFLGLGLLQAQNITTPEPTEVWTPEPRVVTPAESNHLPPSDALVLFDGTNLDHWAHEDGTSPKWTVNEGVLTVEPGSGAIQTKEAFGDIQLHLEWSAPDKVEGEGQQRGNSGLFLQKRYEIQILDSYENRTYSNGQAGSVYKQGMPLVNAMRAPNQWNTYDLVYTQPQFNQDGQLIKEATITLFHNGVLVQNHYTVKGTTEYIGLPKNEAHGPGPLMLQDHDNPVQFRNIWIRKL